MKKYSFIFCFIFIVKICFCQETKTLGAVCALTLYKGATLLNPTDTLVLCPNDTFQLRLNVHGSQCYGSVQWKNNGINITGASTRTYTVRDTGLYSLHYSIYSGDFGSIRVISCFAAGVKDNITANFHLFPNPVSDKLIIQYIDFESATIEIYNSLDQIVLTKKLATQIEEIDLSFLESGIYYISLDNGKGIMRQKIIKNAH